MGEMGHKFLFPFFRGNEWMHQKKTFLLPDFLLLPDNKRTQGLDYGGGGKPVKSLIRTVPQTLLEILVTSVGPPPIPFFACGGGETPTYLINDYSAHPAPPQGTGNNKSLRINSKHKSAKVQTSARV